MPAATLRDAFRSFTTTCALITVHGPRGPNVMAAEWTFNVSYDPFLIAVHIDPENVTHDELLAAGEFGVNLVTEAQGAAMRFAGHFSKADTEKLTSDVFETYPGKKIRAPMIRGSLLNAECRLVQHIRLGDHTAFIGEVVEFSVDPEARPLILHYGSHRLGEKIERRPGLTLAVSASTVAPGSEVTLRAEFAGPTAERLQLDLLSANGDERRLATADTDGEPSFEIPLRVPEDLAAGRYTVIARVGAVEGRATLEVSTP